MCNEEKTYEESISSEEYYAMLDERAKGEEERENGVGGGIPLKAYTDADPEALKK